MEAVSRHLLCYMGGSLSATSEGRQITQRAAESEIKRDRFCSFLEFSVLARCRLVG